MFATIKGYLYLAAVLAILAAVGGIYAKGRLDANHAAQLAALQQQVAKLHAQAKADAAAAKLDTIQAKLDAEDLYAAAQRTQDLMDKLNAPDTVCFDDHDAGLVRDLWGPPAPAHPTGH
jgi:hypothetical protein